MPLTKKGSKIKAAMEKEYGSKKGDSVFYASKNKGTIKGVDKMRKKTHVGTHTPRPTADGPREKRRMARLEKAKL